MPKRGKQYRDAVKGLDRSKVYSVEEAVTAVKKAKFAKFVESVDIQIRLGVDPRNADQQVRGTVQLPHGTGRDVRVAVFAQGDKAVEAKEAGAEIVGSDDLVKMIKDGNLDFDAAVATPDMMRFVGQVGKILGPRGLMPNPKAGTVTMDVASVVRELKAGKVEYRLDRQAIVHCSVGKANFEDSQLVENVRTLLDALNKAKPASAKGIYMRSIALSSTMGPGFAVQYA